MYEIDLFCPAKRPIFTPLAPHCLDTIAQKPSILPALNLTFPFVRPQETGHREGVRPGGRAGRGCGRRGAE